jgi:uncharacterized protein (DUF169 family)
MNEVKLLEEELGGRWTGIAFHREMPGEENFAKWPMRLCQAIKESYTKPIVLTRELINCPGGLRSLGWTVNQDEAIAQRMVQAAGIKPDTALELVRKTPCLNGDIAAVSVGVNNSPDIVLSYAQPEVAMRLVRRWQQVYGTELSVKASGVMAVCGAVVVRAYKSGDICLSFGCPDSRQYGAIGRDRLAISLPVQLIEALF